MHGYYLYYHDILDPHRKKTGIDRKVEGQIAALNNAGITCELFFCEQPESTIDIVKSCLPFFSDRICWPDPKELTDADFLYIRRPRFASKEFISFLTGFRKINPSAKIVYEIPTYPYDPEMSSLKYRPALLKDRKYRDLLQNYVDAIADLSCVDEIFGVPTLQIVNGIDFGNVGIRHPNLEENRVNVMMAASFEPWHGIDRFIRGLADYYDEGGERNVMLHLAGEGTQMHALKALVKRLGLDKHVIFYGYLDSKELDELYDKCDLGIECLGIHRRDPSLRSSSIKSREYIAKGIPFITSSAIDVFEKDPQFFYRFIEASDTAVSIEDVLDFRDTIYNTEEPEILAIRMREFGKSTISMEKAFGNVAAFLLEE